MYGWLPRGSQQRPTRQSRLGTGCSGLDGLRHVTVSVGNLDELAQQVILELAWRKRLSVTCVESVSAGLVVASVGDVTATVLCRAA